MDSNMIYCSTSDATDFYKFKRHNSKENFFTVSSLHIIKMIRFLNDDDFSIRRTGGICRPTNPQVTLGIGMQTRETTSLSRSSSVFDAY